MIRFRKESLQVRDYDDTKKFLATRYPGRGELLEVGSGLGYLLAFFRNDGWRVLGVEPNAGLNRHAEKVLGLRADRPSCPMQTFRVTPWTWSS